MNHFSFTHDQFIGRTFMSGAAEADDLTMVIRFDTPKKSESYHKDLLITIGETTYLSAKGIYFPDSSLKPLMIIGSIAKQIRLGLLRLEDQEDVDELVEILEGWYEDLGGGELFSIDEHGDIDCSHEVYFSADTKIKTPGCTIEVERWTNGWIYNDVISVNYGGEGGGMKITKVYSGESTPAEPTRNYILNLIKEFKEQTATE